MLGSSQPTCGFRAPGDKYVCDVGVHPVLLLSKVVKWYVCDVGGMCRYSREEDVLRENDGIRKCRRSCAMS